MATYEAVLVDDAIIFSKSKAIIIAMMFLIFASLVACCFLTYKIKKANDNYARTMQKLVESQCIAPQHSEYAGEFSIGAYIKDATGRFVRCEYQGAGKSAKWMPYDIGGE